MERFLEERFDYDLKVIDFHKNFLKKYNFQSPKINYLNLYKFLINATNFLKDIDPDFLESIGLKLYEDITSLWSFKQQWDKRRLNYYKYFQEYLNTIPDYNKNAKKIQNIKEKMEKLQKIIKSTELYLKSHPDDKKIKREHVDAIYEYSILKEEYDKIKDELANKENSLEKNFKFLFDEFSKELISDLSNILNIKLYYFAVLVFTHAKESYLINKFANKSGVEISMKSMIQYFIKNYEISGNNIDWINYLKNILREV